jgi:hypothetical protein
VRFKSGLKMIAAAGTRAATGWMHRDGHLVAGLRVR